MDCRARRIANSPEFYASELSHRILPEYRALLDGVGAGSAEAAHRLVVAWRRRIDVPPWPAKASSGPQDAKTEGE
jgi:hypothetical protein